MTSDSPLIPRLRALIEELRESAVVAERNAENPKIPPLDQRQCFGVSQAYTHIAGRLDAMLAEAEDAT